MYWINLHSSTLDSPEFVGAEPHQRSTWICLLRFCCGQENAGRISGAASWSDRRWQQLVRITLKEIRSRSELWRFDGEDLLVNFYPIKKENEIKAKRKAGQETVAKRWETQQTPHRSADSSANSSAISSTPKEQDTEGERKGKGKEGEGEESSALTREQLRSLPPDLDQPEFRAAWADWVSYLTERNHGNPLASQTFDAHLRAIATLTPTAAVEAIRNSIAKHFRQPLPPYPKNSFGGTAAPLSIPDGAPPEAWTGGLKDNDALATAVTSGEPTP